MTTDRTYGNSGSLGDGDAMAATRDDARASTGFGAPAFAEPGSNGDRLTSAATGVVERVADTAQQQLGAQAESQLARMGDLLEQVAGAVRQGGGQLRDQQPMLAGFADKAASKVEGAAQFARTTDLDGLLRETERFARRQPAVFLGGALAVGLAASRFLKASPRPSSVARPHAAGMSRYDR